MNCFRILSCVDLTEDENTPYKGPAVVLVCVSDPTFMLFFPISSDNADVISYILEGNEDYDVDTGVLGIYKTMVDSWKSEDVYLSGIIMDTFYSTKNRKYLPFIRLSLVDGSGALSSLVEVSFVHALLLAAMESVNFIVSDESLAQMIPDAKDLKNKGKKSSLPDSKDDNIIKIARDIMSGNVKDK